MMTHLTCDLDPSDEVYIAFQGLLNAFSRHRQKCNATEKERDKLLELVTKFGIQDPFDDSALNDDRRKRMKTDSPKLDDSTKSTCSNTTNDDLNAAFSISVDDEVIAPTQFEENPIQLHKSPRKLRSFNKENDSTKSPIRNKKNYSAVVERSPTVLTRQSTNLKPKAQTSDSSDGSLICQTRSMSIVKESPKWQRAKSSIAKATPRRLFDSITTVKNSPSMLHGKRTTTAPPRKKVSLSLNTSRTLKQSTINFKKHEEEETYCEDASIQIGYKQHVEAQSPSQPKIKIEPNKSPVDASVIILSKGFDETIKIEESQPTQELFKHVLDIKNEMSTEMEGVSPNVSHTEPPSPVNKPQISKTSTGCADCDKYHQMIGRDLDKNPPKKIGVCSKHHRNILRPDTPPGFWNPKIQDSDEETPFDPRFVKH